MAGFEGFPREGLRFLDDLKSNNNKTWFESHRDDFDRYLLDPAKGLVVDLGRELQERVSSGINVDPRINGSIMRMNRDIRFSKDKTPYKTYLGLWFWEGKGRSMDSSGLYLGLDAGELTLGAGKHGFERAMLDRYRSAVVDQVKGAELATVVERIRRSGTYDLGGQHYKQVPPGYDRNHEHAALLLHDALFAHVTLSVPEVIHTPAFVGFCLGHYLTLAPLHRWLVQVSEMPVA